MRIDQIAKEISKSLAEYSDEITEGLEEIKEEEADLTIKDIKANARNKGLIFTGDYIKGWRKKRTDTGFIIHNPSEYRLTHLLEKGHAKVSGGRVQAFPHIEPAEQDMINRYEKRVEGMIKRG